MKIVVDIPETALCGVIPYLDVPPEGFNLHSKGITADEVTKARNEAKMAEIELQAMRNSANAYKAELEKAKAEIERLNGCAVSEERCREIAREMIPKFVKQARAEAIKEFAEAVKTEFYDCWYFGRDVAERRIDQLAKEMGVEL